jgi:hypothetical protein
VIQLDWSREWHYKGVLKGFSYAIDQRPPFVLTENSPGGRDWVLLVCLFLFDTSSILREMSVVLVAASCSTPVLTLAANSGCMRLHFVRSTGKSPLVPAIRGNSVVGTYCKVALTSLGGTLGLSEIDGCALGRPKWIVPTSHPL